MDIVRAFADPGATHGISINIQGTPEDPLFQANQIGALLGLVNVHESIKDFDDDERAIRSTVTPGGQQRVIFLTELGLYRLLGASRKPCARPFQKWVAKVVRDIRQTGKHETELRLDQAVHALEDKQHAAEKARHDALLACNENVSCVYVVIVMVISATCYIVKFGETDNLRKRLMGLKTLYRMATLLDVFASNSAHGFEQDLLHTPAFKELKYDGLVNGHRGAELFVVDEGRSYDEFFRPLIGKKFEDHKRLISTMEERRMRFEEQRLRIEEQRLELTKSIFQARLPSADLGAIAAILYPSTPPPIDVEHVERVGGREPFLAHRPTDKRVQQYDKLLALVAVHEGLREAARAVAGGKSSGIRTACVNNALYLGYRWHLVDRQDDGASNAAALAPTAPPKRRSGRVAQLSLDETVHGDRKMRAVVAVHQDQVAAAESVGLASSTSITNALRFKRVAGRHMWSLFDDLDDVQRADWDARDARDASATSVCSNQRGRRVEQLDPVTREVLRTFPTMSAVCHEMQASHKMLHAATSNGSVYKDFRWNIL